MQRITCKKGGFLTRGGEAQIHKFTTFPPTNSMKLIMRVTPITTNAMKSVEILKSITSNPFIITPIETIRISNEIQQIYECYSGDLRSQKRRISGDVNRINYVREKLGKALQYMHSLKLVHRDLKPANVLLDRKTWRIVIADLGVAKQYDSFEMMHNNTYQSRRIITPYNPPTYTLQLVEKKSMPIAGSVIDVTQYYNVVMFLLFPQDFDSIFEPHRWRTNPAQCYKEYEIYLNQYLKHGQYKDEYWVKNIINGLLNGVNVHSPVDFKQKVISRS
eukprot:497597_1